MRLQMTQRLQNHRLCGGGLRIQSTISMLVKWADEWQMEFNSDKYYVHVGLLMRLGDIP